jgi:hypothetical protein
MIKFAHYARTRFAKSVRKSLLVIQLYESRGNAIEVRRVDATCQSLQPYHGRASGNAIEVHRIDATARLSCSNNSRFAAMQLKCIV